MISLIIIIIINETSKNPTLLFPHIQKWANCENKKKYQYNSKQQQIGKEYKIFDEDLLFYRMSTYRKKY
jgi:hypothetical protein